MFREFTTEKQVAYVPVYTGGSQRITRTATASPAERVHPLALLFFFICILAGVVLLIAGIAAADKQHNDLAALGGVAGFVLMLALGFIFMFCMKVADRWDRVVVLRMGKFHTVQPAGLFWLAPFVDTVAKWIDTRVQSSDLTAEQTLTKDTVPVDVDAVMFWLVHDPRKASLEVKDFESAVTWAAQTALRDLIGQTMLADLLVGRTVLDKALQEVIDARTEPWGVSVQSVEIREIKIPGALQDTMSRQAQAERERQARVILGESEKQIAQSFAEASAMYRDNPTALHLRAMNMLFEGLKEKGSMMIVPSSALDSMNIGALSGMATMGMNSIQAQQIAADSRAAGGV
jgi:regulator of protease activity HflC (stomatin/prohibitin superfamily)